MAIMEFSINPIGTGKPSVAAYIARAVEVIEKEKGIKYSVTAMGTIVEGDLDKLLALVQKAAQAVFDSGVQRVVTFIKIDDRRDRPSTMESKMDALKKELGAVK